MAEHYCNRHFITHEYELYFSSVVTQASLIFPDCALKKEGIHEPINWINEFGNVGKSSLAYIDAYSNPSIAYLNSNFTIPKLREDSANSFWIKFKTGFGDAATDVPDAIKQAIKLIVSDMYYFREDRKRRFPMASEILLQPYKCYH